MNQSLKYERCKQQTEAKLLEIKDLELQICYVQKQLDQKRKSILQNRQKEDYFDKLCHHHAYYQQQLTKLLSSAEKNNQESINNRPTTPTGGKRDLAEILGTTPDVFSKKIEQIIEQQLKSKQMASERELLQIQQLLDRLPRNDSTIVSTFNRVLKRLIAEMEGLKVNDDNYITPRVNKEITSEQQTITERDKTMYQLEHRKKMNALLNKKEKLESEARTVERQLIRRVRELHSDPAVQSALVKNMRTKSGNQQVKAELQSVLSQIEDMEKKIETIQKDNSLTEMESLISDVLRKINQKQTEIHILANANEEHQKLNNNIGNKLKDRKETEYTNLLETIETVKSNLLTRSQPLKETKKAITEEQEQAEETFSKIKESLYSTYSISNIESLSRILEIVEAVYTLSDELTVNVDIQTMLAQLKEKWQTSIQTDNLPLPDSIEAVHRDRKDNPLLQYIDELEAYIQNVHTVYSKEKEEKYRSKLEIADKVEDEVNQILGVLRERELIKQIGNDYTVAKRTFGEWLELLRAENNNQDDPEAEYDKLK